MEGSYVKTLPVFDSTDEKLPLIEEMISFHAINPFVAHNSSARAYMASSHISQMLTLNNGEEKIIQCGIEKQLSENTFSKKIENDSRVIALIRRYDGIDANSVTHTAEFTLIYEDLVSGEIDYIDVPYYFGLHQYFGFRYTWNTDIINSLYQNTIIPAGTILADSPTVSKNGGYKYGINANVAMTTIPEVAEDGIIISESMSKKLTYTIFEKRTVDFGEKAFPLNIYGDDNNYKPFPEIGEYINDDSVLMVLRNYDPNLSVALTSVKDTQIFDPLFDIAVYVKGPGGKVVDIKAYHTPKSKKDVYTGTSDSVMKYANGMERYYRSILDVYEKLKGEHYKRYRNDQLPISNRLDSLIVNAYGIINPQGFKLKRSFKKDEVDIFRLEFTISYEISPRIGGKLTDLSGGKGVIVGVWPDDEMPVDKNGNRADVIIDPTSTLSRMNIARLYEQYINGASRKAKHVIIQMINSIDNTRPASEVLKTLTLQQMTPMWNHLLGFIELFETEQYAAYAALTDHNDIRAVLMETVTEELYVFYTVSSKKKAYQIIQDMRQTIYAPDIDSILFNSDGNIKHSVDEMFIAPLYMILLSKTADTFLSTASSKNNHYGLPISVGKMEKYGIPYRNNPVRILSETEGRLYVSYVSRKFAAELKDRASSLATHQHLYTNILTAKIPTNIKSVVNRDIIPYGGDSALQLSRHIMNCAGLDIIYVEE